MADKPLLNCDSIKIEIGQDDYALKVQLVHPVGDEYYLIEQIVRNDGLIEYYTNGEREPKWGNIVSFDSSIKPKKGDDDAD